MRSLSGVFWHVANKLRACAILHRQHAPNLPRAPRYTPARVRVSVRHKANESGGPPGALTRGDDDDGNDGYSLCAGFVPDIA